MEQELGVALVSRSTHTFALIEAGQILFLSVLMEFVAANPGISFEVGAIQGQPSQSDGFNIALVVDHQVTLRDSSQRVRRPGSFAALLFASRTYLKRAAPIHEPADLANRSCLPIASGVLEREWDLRRGKERRRVEVGGPFSSSNIGILAQLAREHQGITVLLQFLAGHSAFGGGLVRVLPDWEAAPGHIVALTAVQIMPAKIVKLMEAIKVARQMPRYWWQYAKGPNWRTTRTTLPLIGGGGSITRLTGWRALDFTVSELPLEGKVQKRIVRPPDIEIANETNRLRQSPPGKNSAASRRQSGVR